MKGHPANTTITSGALSEWQSTFVHATPHRHIFYKFHISNRIKLDEKHNYLTNKIGAYKPNSSKTNKRTQTMQPWGIIIAPSIQGRFKK